MLYISLSGVLIIIGLGVNKEIEKSLVINLGLYFIEGKREINRLGFAYLHNGDTIRDYNYEVHLTRDNTNNFLEK